MGDLVPGAKGTLVTLRGVDGLHLDGILYGDSSNAITILHVHGSLGNFYHSQFVHTMADVYTSLGCNLLAVNVGAHDGLAEGYRNADDFEYVGGSITRFEECVPQIQGAVDFAASFSTKLILQGHSLGCDRVLHYALRTDCKHDLVLISPCDSHELHLQWLAPNNLASQVDRLRKMKVPPGELGWLPAREYGLKAGDGWTYSIPITRDALLSIVTGPPFQLIRPRDPASFRLDQRVFVYIGGRDNLQVWPKDEMFAYFEGRVGSLTRAFFPEGDHMLAGCGGQVAREIALWGRT